MIADDFRLLLRRRRQPARPVMALASLPLAALGAFGWGEGGGYFFVLASICLIQTVYPTLLGWALASLTYVAFAGFYLLWALLERSQLRTDPDRPVFLVALTVLLAIGSGLLVSRPKNFMPPPN